MVLIYSDDEILFSAKNKWAIKSWENMEET